jgi:hypothetical protein
LPVTSTGKIDDQRLNLLAAEQGPRA